MVERIERVDGPTNLVVTIDVEAAREMAAAADAAQAAGYGAGWHCYLDTLDAHLRDVEPPDWDARWSVLLPGYVERLASA